MACREAPTCRFALNSANFYWPERAKQSDGICGDEAHQKRKSDHNIGNAFDLTHDPLHGLDTYSLAEQLRLSGDSRIKYIISFSRIWTPSKSPNWRKYSGSNPHNKHMHVSIHEFARRSKADWWGRFMPKEVDDLTQEEREWLATVHHELRHPKSELNLNLSSIKKDLAEIKKKVATQ